MGVDKNHDIAAHNHFFQKQNDCKSPQHPEGLQRRVIIFVTTLDMDCVTGQDPIGILGVSPSWSLDHHIA